MRRPLGLGLVLLSLSAIASGDGFDPGFFAGLHYRLIGPFRGGRTVAISGVPHQPNVFWMAAVNGGVWKSTDYGLVWRPVFDSAETGSVGALALAPSNPDIVYVGSGEGLQRPDLSVGNGIYKSTDGGKTWAHLGLRDGLQISALVVDPKNPDRLFVAVLGHPYGPNPERGVYRSLDGGKTFEKVLFRDENTGAIDVAFDPANANTLYASLWSARRPPWTTGGTITAWGGLFKSEDGGSHWKPLTAGLPTPEEHLGRIGIAVSPSDPRRLYVWADAKEHSGLFASRDSGETWTKVNGERRVVGRGDDFAGLRVDPRDPETLYVANTSTYRSRDGGRTFTAIKGAPGGDDYHTIWINPENPEILFLGCDQGATISVNGGATWSSWFNQPTAQFYHVSTDNRFPYWVYGGQQESGSAGVASRSDYGIISFRDWHTVGVEEYGNVAPDPLNPDFVYGGKVTRFSHSTGEVQELSPAALATGAYRFNRTAPLLFDPLDPHVLYLGSQVLFATRDGGHTWDILSPDLTRESPGAPANLGAFADLAPGAHRGVIYAIAPSPLVKGLLWAGTDDGLIHVTQDGGKSWKNVTPPSLTPWSKVSILEASHFEGGTAFAAINRLRLDDLAPHVLKTKDGGATWTEIVTGLPADEPVDSVREDPVRKGLLYAGTEGSVQVSFDEGDHWQSLQLNLPHTSMRDLVVHGDDLVIGTHGRSFWILDDLAPLRQLSREVASAPFHLFEPAKAYRVARNRNTDTPLPPETPAGENPPEGVAIDYTLRAAPRGEVTLEILDGAGAVVRRYGSRDAPPPERNDLNVPTYWVRPPRTLSAAPGTHRFYWDLRYAPPRTLDHDYPISAVYHDTPIGPLGPWVVPAAYKVRLTVDGSSQEAPLAVAMDPRIKTAPEALAHQLELSRELTAALERDFAAIQEVRALRESLKKRMAGLSGASHDLGVALEAKLDELDPAAAPPRGLHKDLASLNGNLASLLEIVDGADSQPTTQAEKAVAERDQTLKETLARWQDVKSGDVKKMQEALRAAGKPPL
jgi:photosystem II stability/assembly factor-like uncharacterized protein